MSNKVEEHNTGSSFRKHCVVWLFVLGVQNGTKEDLPQKLEKIDEEAKAYVKRRGDTSRRYTCLADHYITSELKRLKYGFCERLRGLKNNVARERVEKVYSLSCNSTCQRRN